MHSPYSGGQRSPARRPATVGSPQRATRSPIVGRAGAGNGGIEAAFLGKLSNQVQALFRKLDEKSTTLRTQGVVLPSSPEKDYEKDLAFLAETREELARLDFLSLTEPMQEAVETFMNTSHAEVGECVDHIAEIEQSLEDRQEEVSGDHFRRVLAGKMQRIAELRASIGDLLAQINEVTIASHQMADSDFLVRYKEMEGLLGNLRDEVDAVRVSRDDMMYQIPAQHLRQVSDSATKLRTNYGSAHTLIAELEGGELAEDAGGAVEAQNARDELFALQRSFSQYRNDQAARCPECRMWEAKVAQLRIKLNKQHGQLRQNELARVGQQSLLSSSGTRPPSTKSDSRPQSKYSPGLAMSPSLRTPSPHVSRSSSSERLRCLHSLHKMDGHSTPIVRLCGGDIGTGSGQHGENVFLTGATDERALMWKVEEDEIIKVGSMTHDTDSGDVLDVVFHPSYPVVLTITENGYLHLWDTQRAVDMLSDDKSSMKAQKASRFPLQAQMEIGEHARCIVCHPKVPHIVFVGCYRKIIEVDISAMEVVDVGDIGCMSTYAMEMCPSRQLIATAGDDQVVRVVDVQELRVIMEIAVKGTVRDLHWVENGIVVACDSLVHIHGDGFAEQTVLASARSLMFSLAATPSGGWVIGGPNTLTVISSPNDDPEDDESNVFGTLRLKQCARNLVAPIGNRIVAAGSDGIIRLFGLGERNSGNSDVVSI